MSNQSSSTNSEKAAKSKKPQQTTLLNDLEAIRKSLDKIASSKPTIPTLEEIVGHRTPTTVNPQNPFLSSSSLSDLIELRNEAESRAAQELAELKPVKSIEAILKEAETPAVTPDPNIIIEQMETLFDSWVESSVEEYMKVFEGELRNRLQQDFKNLVTLWYKDKKLPLPDGFERANDGSEDDEKPEDDESEDPQANP